MSSILEALRKSDNKRQQGTSKGVDQIQFGEVKPVKKSGKGFYALVFLLLLIAATVWAYQEGYLDRIKDMFVANDVLEPGTIKKVPLNDVAGQKETTKEPVVTALTPPKPKVIKEQIKKQGEIESLDKEKRSLTEAGKEIEKTGVIPVTEERSNPSNRLVIDGKPAAEKRTQSEQLVSGTDFSKKISVSDTMKSSEKPNEKPNEKSNIRTSKMRNKKDVQTDKQAYLLIHQLPYEIRKQMPELKINVHVFDPEPENRMVVINGVSFHVGDSIEDVATVKDITAGGVVVEVAGTVFMIPK